MSTDSNTDEDPDLTLSAEENAAVYAAAAADNGTGLHNPDLAAAIAQLAARLSSLAAEAAGSLRHDEIAGLSRQLAGIGAEISRLAQNTAPAPPPRPAQAAGS